VNAEKRDRLAAAGARCMTRGFQLAPLPGAARPEKAAGFSHEPR